MGTHTLCRRATDTVGHRCRPLSLLFSFRLAEDRGCPMAARAEPQSWDCDSLRNRLVPERAQTIPQGTRWSTQHPVRGSHPNKLTKKPMGLLRVTCGSDGVSARGPTAKGAHRPIRRPLPREEAPPLLSGRLRAEALRGEGLIQLGGEADERSASRTKWSGRPRTGPFARERACTCNSPGPLWSQGTRGGSHRNLFPR